ncbi:hypothetical protein ACFQ7W_03840 [Streptomyces niveus]
MPRRYRVARPAVDRDGRVTAERPGAVTVTPATSSRLGATAGASDI